MLQVCSGHLVTLCHKNSSTSASSASSLIMTVVTWTPRGVSTDRFSGLHPSGAVGDSSDGGGGAAPAPPSSPAEVALPYQKTHKRIAETTFEVPERDREERIGGMFHFPSNTVQRRDVKISCYVCSSRCEGGSAALRLWSARSPKSPENEGARRTYRSLSQQREREREEGGRERGEHAAEMAEVA